MAKKEKKAFELDASVGVGKIDISKGTRFRMRLNRKDDKVSLDLRMWYKTDSMEDFAATPKGVALPIASEADIDRLIKMLKHAKTKLPEIQE